MPCKKRSWGVCSDYAHWRVPSRSARRSERRLPARPFPNRHRWSCRFVVSTMNSGLFMMVLVTAHCSATFFKAA